VFNSKLTCENRFFVRGIVLKIAIVNPILRTPNLGPSLLWSGTPKVPTSEVPEINIVELARELSNIGNNVTVYVADAFVDFKVLHLSDRLTIQAVPARLPRIFPPALIPLTPSLSFSNELRDSDIIQSAEFFQFSSFSAANLAAKEKIPFFIWQESFHYMRPPAKPFQNLFNLTAGKSIKSVITKFILRTKKAKSFLHEIGITDSAIGPWIPTGIDGASFKQYSGTLLPEDFGFPKDFALVLLVARLTPSKGVDLALEALAILRNKGLKVGLLIRGTGPELNNLKALAKELKISDAIKFLGPQSRLEMANLYNSSDALLVSSRMDLFPFALLEAAGCGLPSVSTRVGCIEDFVQDGTNGLLVSPNSVEIAKALERLLTDDRLRTELAKAARRNFTEAFEMSIVARHFDDFYKKFAE
jgi:glycosyltransferase involved in cell wall biosynthesis